MAETTTNPTVSAPSGIGAFFGFLGQVAGQYVGTVAAGEVEAQEAKNKARVQEIMNRNHAANPATGPNDPAAAQVAANRTFLEKFLPEGMLYNTDPLGNKTPSVVYYGIMLGLVVLLILAVRRLFK